MRAIDADALMAKLGIGQDCSICKHDDTPYCCWKPDVVDVCEAICDAPTIEPERKTGKWIVVDDGCISGICSVCGWEAHMYEDDVAGMDYCPNCGARLEGEG